MSEAALLQSRVRNIHRHALPGVGENDVLLRLSRGELREDMPLLNPDTHDPRPSDSPWLDRDALARTLSDYNAEIGNPLDASTQEAIRGDGVFVLGGQQPGLLLGPMYTLLKAVSVIALARRLGAHTSARVIPAFWIAGEDHDLSEVNHVSISGRRFTAAHPELEVAGARPQVADVSPAPWKRQMLDFLDQALPRTPFKGWAKRLVEETDFSNYSVMFAQLMSRVLGEYGMVLVDPIRLRHLTAPALANVVERWPSVNKALEAGKTRLRSHNVDPPLDHVSLFEIGDDGRTPCSTDEHAMRVGGEARSFDRAAAFVREHPERFSPSAGLRPIIQDAAIPTVATVAGPTELSYLWQIDPLYAEAGVRRSLLRPRTQATILDTATIEQARRFGLHEEDLLSVDQAVEQFDPWQGVTGEMPAPLLEDAEDLRKVRRLADELLSAVDRIDPGSHEKLKGKASNSVRHQIDKLTDRVLNERLSREGLGRDNLKRIAQRITPQGKPQERVVSAFEMLARFGPPLVDVWIDKLDVTNLEHQLVEVSEGEEPQ